MDIRIECRKCGGPRNHASEWRKTERIEGTWDPDMYEDVTYEVFTCCGCGTPVFRISRFNPELDVVTVQNPDDTDGPPIQEACERSEAYPRILHYPHRGHFPPGCLPEAVRRAYDDTLHAVDYGLLVLVPFGVRAVLEAVLVEKGFTKGDLFEKEEASSLGTNSSTSAVASPGSTRNPVVETWLYGPLSPTACGNCVSSLSRERTSSMSLTGIIAFTGTESVGAQATKVGKMAQSAAHRQRHDRFQKFGVAIGTRLLHGAYLRFDFIRV